MKIEVLYPSGLRYVLVGDMTGVDAARPGVRLTVDQLLHRSWMRAGQSVCHDPRALYRDTESGAVLYHPREHLDLVPRDVREWLKQHPEWPRDEDLTPPTKAARNAVP